MGAGVRVVCAAAPSAPAPASRQPGQCRLPHASCVHTRLHTGGHAPPPGTCSSLTCGRTPLSAGRRDRSPSPQAGLPLPHSQRGLARGMPGAHHIFLRSSTPSPDPCWDFGTPGRGVPRTCTCRPVDTPAAAAAAPQRPACPLPFFDYVWSPTFSAGSVPTFECLPTSLGPLLLCRLVTFETWNSKGNLKRASCP